MRRTVGLALGIVLLLSFSLQAGEEKPATPAKGEVQLGNAFYQKGQFAEALQHYQKALEVAGELEKGKVHYNLGNTYYQLGQFEEAIRHYKETLRLNPDDENAKYNLERTYLARQGQMGILQGQTEIEGSEEALDEEILSILQVLEQREFDLPKPGVPQQDPPPPSGPPKAGSKDW